MNIKSFARLLFPLLTLLALVACSAGAASPTPLPPTQPPVANTQPPVTNTQAPTEAATSPAETSVPTAASTSAAQGACANPLFPVVNGATWTYAATGGADGSYGYTDTITDVRSDGFTITSKFDDNLTRTQEWACKPEGLVAMQLPGAAATITTQEFHAQFETSNIQGVTIPANVSPGDKWNFSMSIKGTQQVGGTSAQTTGNAVYNFSAVGMESVTVPAGTFNAMKIDGVLTLDITASVAGLSVPVKVTMNSTTWFAPGVGMVKTVTTGNVAGTAVNDTVDLQSYSIPK